MNNNNINNNNINNNLLYSYSNEINDDDILTLNININNNIIEEVDEEEYDNSKLIIINNNNNNNLITKYYQPENEDLLYFNDDTMEFVFKINNNNNNTVINNNNTSIPIIKENDQKYKETKITNFFSRTVDNTKLVKLPDITFTPENIFETIDTFQSWCHLYTWNYYLYLTLVHISKDNEDFKLLNLYIQKKKSLIYFENTFWNMILKHAIEIMKKEHNNNSYPLEFLRNLMKYFNMNIHLKITKERIESWISETSQLLMTILTDIVTSSTTKEYDNISSNEYLLKHVKYLCAEIIYFQHMDLTSNLKGEDIWGPRSVLYNYMIHQDLCTKQFIILLNHFIYRYQYKKIHQVHIPSLTLLLNAIKSKEIHKQYMNRKFFYYSFLSSKENDNFLQYRKRKGFDPYNNVLNQVFFVDQLAKYDTADQFYLIKNILNSFTRFTFALFPNVKHIPHSEWVNIYIHFITYIHTTQELLKLLPTDFDMNELDNIHTITSFTKLLDINNTYEKSDFLSLPYLNDNNNNNNNNVNIKLNDINFMTTRCDMSTIHRIRYLVFHLIHKCDEEKNNILNDNNNMKRKFIWKPNMDPIKTILKSSTNMKDLPLFSLLNEIILPSIVLSNNNNIKSVVDNYYDNFKILLNNITIPIGQILLLLYYIYNPLVMSSY